MPVSQEGMAYISRDELLPAAEEYGESSPGYRRPDCRDAGYGGQPVIIPLARIFHEKQRPEKKRIDLWKSTHF